MLRPRLILAPDGVLQPQDLREPLVDDDHRRRSRVVTLIEFAARRQRDLHRLEKRRPDTEHPRCIGWELPGSRRRRRYADRRHQHGRSTTCGQRAVRQAHAANARQPAQPFPQIAVQALQRLVLVTHRSRPDREQQHVLPVESQFDGVEVRQRAPEQARGHDQHQRESNLRHDEDLAQPHATPAAAGRSGERTGPNLLQRRHQIDAGSLNRRGQPEHQSGEDRKRERHAQHVPVQLRVQREVFAAVGEQEREHADAPRGEQQAEHATDRGEHHAFGQKLSNDPHPAGADAEPHSDFAPPRRRARQQQVGDVGARNQQNQARHRHQDVDRLRVSPPEAVQTRAAFQDPQFGNVRALAIGCRRGLGETPELWPQHRPGLSQPHTGFEPAHDLDPVEVRVQIRRCPDRFEHHPGSHRHIEVRNRPGLRAEEPRRRHADHREGLVVDSDGSADRQPGVSEASLAEPVAQHGDGLGPGFVIARKNQTSPGGRHAHPAEVVSRHVLRFDGFRFVVDRDAQAFHDEKAEGTRQHVGVAFEQLEGWVGKLRADPPFLGIAK